LSKIDTELKQNLDFGLKIISRTGKFFIKRRHQQECSCPLLAGSKGVSPHKIIDLSPKEMVAWQGFKGPRIQGFQ
jgi:hypothetical protein